MSEIKKNCSNCFFSEFCGSPNITECAEFEDINQFNTLSKEKKKLKFNQWMDKNKC